MGGDVLKRHLNKLICLIVFGLENGDGGRGGGGNRGGDGDEGNNCVTINA